MRCRDLEEIREKIACPQFGDNHYGEWGALRLEQRETILRLVSELQFLRKQYYYELKQDRLEPEGLKRLKKLWKGEK